MKPDRVSAIRTQLFPQGFSSVKQIAGAVGLSEPTVRRDLQAHQMLRPDTALFYLTARWRQRLGDRGCGPQVAA